MSTRLANEKTVGRSATREKRPVRTPGLRAWELATLADIGSIFSSSLNLDELFDPFAEQLRRLVPYDRVLISLLQREGGAITSVYQHGTPVEGHGIGYAVSVDGSLSGHVLATRDSFAVPDADDAFVREFPQMAAPVRAGLRGLLCVPLIARDLPIGALHIQSKSLGVYGPRDLRIAEAVASQISGALSNARLHESLQLESRERATLAEISKIINASSKLDDVFEWFAALVSILVPLDRLTVCTITPGEPELDRVHVHGVELSARALGNRFPVAGTAIGEVIATNRPIVFGDLGSGDAIERFPALARPRGGGLRSWMSVPLMSEGRAIGAMAFSSLRKFSYGRREVAVAERVASQISGAVANATLNVELEQELEEREVLAEISRIISSSLDLSKVFDEFSGQVGRLVPADRVVVTLHDRSAGVAMDRYIYGVKVPDRDGRAPENLISGETAQAVTHNRAPVLLGSSELANSDPATRPGLAASHRAGLHSAMFAPLVSNGALIGTLNIKARKKEAYEPRHLAVLGRIAAQVAPAVESAVLHDELQSEGQARGALAEIGRAVNSDLDIDHVYEEMAGQLGRLISYDRLVVTLMVPGSELVRCAYVAGVEIPGHGAGTLMRAEVRMSDWYHPMPGAALATGSEGEIEQASEIVNAGLKSWLEVSLGDPDDPIGYLNLRSAREKAYTERDAHLLARIADQIAPAIENARLYEALRQESAQTTTLGEIGRIVSSSPDIEEIYERFAAEVRKLIGFDRIAINTLASDGRSFTLRYVWGVAAEGHGEGDVLPLEGTATAKVVESRSPVIYDPASGEEAVGAFPKAAGLYRAGLRSMLCVPLVARNEVIGTLHFRSMAPQAFTPEDAQLATQVAAQISGAVANAELRAEALKQAELRAVLAEIGRIVSSNLDLGSVFQGFGRQLQKLVAADRIVVAVLDEDLGYLTDKHIFGLRMPEWDDEPKRHVPALTTRQVILDRTAMMLGEERFASAVPGREPGLHASYNVGLRNGIFVPLISDDVVIGTLSIKTKRAEPYGRADLETLERAASQIAGAVAASELHLKTLRLARERELRMRAEAEKRELERVAIAKNEFLSTVSHELRTPLTSMVAYADILARNRSGHLDESEKMQAAIIRRNGDRLTMLINDLLDVSRLDSGTLELQRSSFDVREFFAEIMTIFEPILESREQRLSSRLPRRESLVCIDRDRLGQIVSNLISNASKYSARGAEIELRAGIRGDKLWVLVRDHGIGISRNDQQRLFTPFFRADNDETRATPGTGLGLVIVKTLIELHGGSVSLSSAEGSGTTVRFTIPDISAESTEECVG